VTSCAWGRSKRVSAITKNAINFKFVVWTTLATAFGIVFSIGAVYLTMKYVVLIDQAEVNHSVVGSRGSAELSPPDGRFTRVRLLLQ
jgi:hypothetical protein